MKKLLGIIIFYLLFNNIAYAQYFDLNECFYFKRSGLVQNNTWNEYNNKKWRGLDPKFDKEGKGHKIYVYEGERFEDNLYSVNIDSGLVTAMHIYNDDYLRAMRENLYEWALNNPKLKKKFYDDMNADIDQDFREKIDNKIKYEITDFAGGIIFAESKLKIFNTLLKIEINLKKKTVFESSEKLDKNKFFYKGRNDLYQCNKSSGSEKEVGGSSGTAFFINNKGHLLTNNHVVEGCTISKVSYKNKDYDTKLIATDKTLDLALLKAELKPKIFFNFSNNETKKLSKIYVAGYPLGKGLSDDLKISSGIVSSLKGFEDNSNEIQIDAPINPGNSGGPIINENGDLVAIAVSGLAKDQTEGINFGIKSSAAESFLLSNNINPKKSMYSGIKDNDQLLEILEEGTVYTYCNN
jgi:hypothetical protein